MKVAGSVYRVVGGFRWHQGRAVSRWLFVVVGPVVLLPMLIWTSGEKLVVKVVGVRAWQG